MQTRNVLLNRAERIALAAVERDLQGLQAEFQKVVAVRDELAKELFAKHNLPENTRLVPVPGQEGSFIAEYSAQDAADEGKVLQMPPGVRLESEESGPEVE